MDRSSDPSYPLDHGEGWQTVGIIEADGFTSVIALCHPANSKFIAAAPDLYAALEALLDCPDIGLENLEPETIEAINQAQTALRKATE